MAHFDILFTFLSGTKLQCLRHKDCLFLCPEHFLIKIAP